ncbi:MAG: SEC-C metal-binding domain-containing protein [Pyrinomonadaceae bacterium]
MRRIRLREHRITREKEKRRAEGCQYSPVHLICLRSVQNLEFCLFIYRPAKSVKKKRPRRRPLRALGTLDFRFGTAPPEGDVAQGARRTPFDSDLPKVKPNEPCYCGSGKKFKKYPGGWCLI